MALTVGSSTWFMCLLSDCSYYHQNLAAWLLHTMSEPEERKSWQHNSRGPCTWVSDSLCLCGHISDKDCFCLYLSACTHILGNLALHVATPILAIPARIAWDHSQPFPPTVYLLISFYILKKLEAQYMFLWLFCQCCLVIGEVIIWHCVGNRGAWYPSWCSELHSCPQKQEVK